MFKSRSTPAEPNADLITLDLNDYAWGQKSEKGACTVLVNAISHTHLTDVMVDGKWLLGKIALLKVVTLLLKNK